MDSLLQSAALKMSSVVTPCIDAADVLAPLTEWALNVLVSIPAEVVTSFNHVAIVDDVTGWWGFIKEMNNCVLSPLSALVLSTYMSRDYAGHILETEGKRIILTLSLVWIVWLMPMGGTLSPLGCSCTPWDPVLPDPLSGMVWSVLIT